RPGSVRCRHLVAVHIDSRFRSGAGLARAADHGRAGCHHGGLAGIAGIRRGAMVLATLISRLPAAGPSGVGDHRVVARLVSQRLPVVVTGVFADRYLAGWSCTGWWCVSGEPGPVD